MSAFFKAELKDKFLQYALEREDYFEAQLLYDEFLRPNYSLEYVEKLIREIIDYNSALLDIMSGNGSKIFMLSATAHTPDFLEEGGFKDLYIEEEEKWDTFLEQLSNTRKLTSEEKASLGHTEKETYKRERRLLYGLITAVAISFLFTLFSLLRPIFYKSEKARLEEMETKINVLENQNHELREELDSIQYLYGKNSQ
jgi:hypothetical protein